MQNGSIQNSGSAIPCYDCRLRIILVELIVVLVILAILAAILVPALLGWIDKAREKQYVLDARNVYVAAQAVVDEEYARTGKAPATDDEFAALKTKIVDIADTDFTSITSVGYNDREGTAAGDTAKNAEIKAMVITGLESNGSTCTATLSATGWAITNVVAATATPTPGGAGA